MHTSKAYKIHVRISCLILMERITLMLGKMNAVDTSEMNVFSAGKVNTLSFFYVLSHTSCIFSFILLWKEIHLELLPLTISLV